MSQGPYNYVLCSNPRSGTTLLCDMLDRTGLAGKPNSFFRQKSLLDWCESWDVPEPRDAKDSDFTKRYLSAMLREGQNDTSVFGLRLMGPDLGYCTSWLRRHHPDCRSDHAAMEATFGPLRFIHLTRQDKLAEAVSYLRAEQTGLWHQNADGSAMEQIDPSEPDGFDADAIAARLSMLTRYEQDWTDWFEREGITPLRQTYESLAEDPQSCLADVLAYIGQDRTKAATVTPGLRKLADVTSTDWIQRYRALFPSR